MFIPSALQNVNLAEQQLLHKLESKLQSILPVTVLSFTESSIFITLRRAARAILDDAVQLLSHDRAAVPPLQAIDGEMTLIPTLLPHYRLNTPLRTRDVGGELEEPNRCQCGQI